MTTQGCHKPSICFLKKCSICNYKKKRYARIFFQPRVKVSCRHYDSPPAGARAHALIVTLKKVTADSNDVPGTGSWKDAPLPCNTVQTHTFLLVSCLFSVFCDFNLWRVVAKSQVSCLENVLCSRFVLFYLYIYFLKFIFWEFLTWRSG